MAVVDQQGQVLEKQVIPITGLVDTVTGLIKQHVVSVIVIGNRTNSKVIKNSLLALKLPVVTVEENNSTVEGRYRYLKENTKGLAKLLPIGLRIPREPFDDYVAVILAERYLQELKSRPS